MFASFVRSSLLRTSLALALSAGTLATVTAPAFAQAAANAAPAPVDLPIRKITLYRSGVASFERSGSVTGDGVASLRFRTEQVNDILKSLVVLDLSGGSIDGVNYASQEPLAKRLSSFGIDISDSPTLQQILARLCGSRLIVQTADKTVTGTILGGETRPEAVGEATQLVNVPYVTLITEQGIVAVNLNTARGIKLEDEKLNAELMKALAAVAEYREDRTKTVDIRFSGVGTRNVQTTYVHEAPVWKTSYRLVLPDAKEDAKQDKPLMQGWAIVENTTDNDWNDVQLSLVSGRPASFQMNLYDPIFTTRPMVAVPVPQTLIGQVYDDASETEFVRRVAADEDGRALAKLAPQMLFDRAPGAPAAGKPASAMRGAGGQSPMLGETAEFVSDSSAGFGSSLNMYTAASNIASVAAGLQTGEVFFFRLSRPVTIERQRSAMLPIVSQTIEGRRVSIIGVNDAGPNPMRGVQMTNDTGLQLIAGPVSIFDGDAYAGDAQMGDTSKGDKRLLSYSVDQDVLFTRENSVAQQITRMRIVNGLLESSVVWRDTTKITVDNKDEDNDRTIIAEIPKVAGAELKDGAKPVETSAAFYRFEFEVAPKSKAELNATQERIESSSAYLMNYSIEQLMYYRTSGAKLSDAVLNAFRKAQELQAAINTANQTVTELDTQRNEITRDQDRIRQNMSSIDRNSDYYNRLLKKLSDQETQVEQLDAQLRAARTNAQKAEEALNSYLSTLNVE